jgi:hypothetical protein
MEGYIDKEKMNSTTIMPEAMRLHLAVGMHRCKNFILQVADQFNSNQWRGNPVKYNVV